MNAGRARRRWLKWCRYVDKTQTRTRKRNMAGIHVGQVKAYSDASVAQRYYPKGLRMPWYPYWGIRR